MGRWADDPEAAADALIERSMTALELGGRVLLVNQHGRLPSTLAAQGLAATVWNRRQGGAAPARAWPPPGPFDVALLRLPKARAEVEMSAHAAASVLAPGGRLLVYGGNDEGIRSSAAVLEDLCGAAQTIAVRARGRILAAACPPEGARSVRTPLEAWRTVVRLELGGTGRDWAVYPGLFAAGRLDEGTALLVGALPVLRPGAAVLDFGCGSGVIGAAVLAQQPDTVLDLIDNDAVAVQAAGENVRQARAKLGAGLADAGTGAYDAILSNPPLHAGIAEDRTILERLVAEAPGRLQPGGVLQVVVQARVPLEAMLAGHFGGAEVVAQTTRYRVWRARRA